MYTESTCGVLFLKWVLIVVIAVQAGPVAAESRGNEPLTNRDVIELVAAGLGDGTIIRQIERSHPDFDLSSSGLRELSAAGVSDAIILAMMDASDDDPPRSTRKQRREQLETSASGRERDRVDDADRTERSRYFNAGAGARALTVANGISGVDDEHFNGGEVFFTASFPHVERWLGVSGNIYYLTHSDGEFDDLDVLGTELEVKAGYNIATRGFKGYGLLGVYAEEWENDGDSETFSGLHIGAGLGWNWEWVSLDFQLRVRDSRDYEDFYEDAFNDDDVVGVTGNVRVGIRF